MKLLMKEGRKRMKAKAALFLTGILLIAGIPFPSAAEEVVVGDGVITEAMEQLEEVEVQGISWWTTEPVSQVAARSGRLDVRPLSKTEIANLYQDAKNSSTPLSYDVQPHVGAPYAAGCASAANRQSTLKELNMYRLIAGITPVAESAELSVEAQHGAVLLAAVNQLTHYPSKPAEKNIGATCSAMASCVSMCSKGLPSLRSMTISAADMA